MILIFDTVTLINLTTRTQKPPLLEVLLNNNFKIHIVNEVYEEYCRKPKEKSYIMSIMNKYHNLNICRDFDIDENDYLDFYNNYEVIIKGLGKGEMFSFYYANKLHRQGIEIKLYTDDFTAQEYIKTKSEFSVGWTSSIISEMIELKLINKNDANDYYQEMINNGFKGDGKITF